MTGSAAAPARIGDLARAFMRAGRWRELAAVVLGATIGALLSVSLSLALAISSLGDAWATWPLPWLSLSDAFLVVAVIVCWQAASIVLMPRRLRRAQEAQTWIGERDLAGWHHVTASPWWSLPPTSPPAAERWLERHPESPTIAYARVEVLLLAQRFDEAAASIAALTTDTDRERIARADLLATLRLMADGEVELDELRDAAAAAAGDDQLAGRCYLAVMESRAQLRAGGDWLQPLESARDVLGHRADAILWRRFLPRRLLAIAPIAGLVLLAFGLLRLIGT